MAATTSSPAHKKPAIGYQTIDLLIHQPSRSRARIVSLFLFFIVPLCFASSCGPRNPNIPPNNAIPTAPTAKTLSEQVTVAQNSLQDVQVPLAESGQHIDNARTSTLIASNKAIDDELVKAKAKLDEGKTLINKTSVSVSTAMNTASQVVSNAEQSDKNIQSLKTANENLEKKLSSESKWIYKMLAGIAGFIIVAGIGICIASAVIGFASIRIGIFVSVGGVALLVLTLTLQKYEIWFMALCGAGILFVLGYFCWQLFASNKANKELVQFGEALKAKADPNLKKTLFGDNNDPQPNSVADSIQSDSTQKIVSQLRKQLQIEQIKKN